MQQKTRLNLILLIKVILCSIMLFFIIMGSLWAYSEVFKPAYISVVVSCNINTAESFGYVTAGSFTVGSKNKSMDGITIYVPPKYDDSWQGRNLYMETRKYEIVMQHEKIHKLQYERGMLYGCDHKFLKYLNEVEAYIRQYF